MKMIMWLTDISIMVQQVKKLKTDEFKIIRKHDLWSSINNVTKFMGDTHIIKYVY